MARSFEEEFGLDAADAVDPDVLEEFSEALGRQATEELWEQKLEAQRRKNCLSQRKSRANRVLEMNSLVDALETARLEKEALMQAHMELERIRAHEQAKLDEAKERVLMQACEKTGRSAANYTLEVRGGKCFIRRK